MVRAASFLFLLIPFVFVESAAGSFSTLHESPRTTFVEKTLALVDLLVAKHVNRPSRTQVLRGGVKRIAETFNLSQEEWLGRFEAAGDECGSTLGNLFDAAQKSSSPGSDMTVEMGRGILAGTPGGAAPVDAEEAKVDKSLTANRYVGVGVYLKWEDRPKVTRTFYGGPAHEAGIKPGETIYEINGLDTAKMDLQEFMTYARGPSGSEVIYVMGHPGSKARRPVKMIRRETPRQTVSGVFREDSGEWNFSLPNAPAAYVKVESFDASSAHELRRAARRIRDDRVKAVILDLRECWAPDAHCSVLVADALLAGGVIGSIRSKEGDKDYIAGPDALFGDLSMAVLVGPRTRGGAEWLAASLRMRKRAILVGQNTPGASGLRSTFEVPGWTSHVRFVTQWLLSPHSADQSKGSILRSVQPDKKVGGADTDPIPVALESLGLWRSA